MKFNEFHNGLRVLMCLSGAEFLGCLNDEDREYFGDEKLLEKFRANPHRNFCELPTQDAERLFAIIQEKNAKSALRAINSLKGEG